MRKKSAALTIAAAFICLCCACGMGAETSQNTAPESIAGHAWDYSMDIQYAEGFQVDYYEGGYALINIGEDGQFLVIPEGQSVYREQTLPEGLDESVTVLTQPVTDIYLAASAVMDMFVSLDALSNIRFSALDVDGWYIDEAVESMEAGDILYAGKYSAPDYELILSEGCSLAIENTMIYHTPEVKEELESLGIPVLVDYSSYETDPLGRMEWVKLYGVLTGETELAEQVFETQAALYEKAADEEETGFYENAAEEETGHYENTEDEKETTLYENADDEEQNEPAVAFFYITTNGAVNVRKTSDYLPKMIEQAGGVYIFADLGEEDDSASSTVTMQMEEFYAAAKDADYLIYNSTVEGELDGMEDFLAQSELLENFKAVSEDHVYCTTKNLYQSSMELGTITSDIRKMLQGDTENLTYLYKLS